MLYWLAWQTPWPWSPARNCPLVWRGVWHSPVESVLYCPFAWAAAYPCPTVTNCSPAWEAWSADWVLNWSASVNSTRHSSFTCIPSGITFTQWPALWCPLDLDKCICFLLHFVANLFDALTLGCTICNEVYTEGCHVGKLNKPWKSCNKSATFHEGEREYNPPSQLDPLTNLSMAARQWVIVSQCCLIKTDHWLYYNDLA